MPRTFSLPSAEPFAGVYLGSDSLAAVASLVLHPDLLL